MSEGPSPNIALVGSPNSGKTTLFNALTGLRAKTGNYPGVTVDRREGVFREGPHQVRLVDLPGTYSLHAISEDEAVSVQVLRGELEGVEAPDAIVVVADATTLERSLPMIAEVLLLGRPTLLALTMIDELKARGGDIDLFALKRELGVPVIGVVGNRGLGVADLREQLLDPASWTPSQNLPGGDTEARFAWADALLQRITRHPVSESRLTRRLDGLLLHPIFGGLIFLAFVTFFFQAIFTWAGPAMDAFAGALDQAADWTLVTLPESWATDLLADGVIRGVGSVVVFVPQIALLFALILFFEACGYMARAAFVVDRIMGWVGLEGRCFVALLSSYACALPGVMATRTIPSPKDRLATILVAPLATCSARLPVYALLISAFVPAAPVFGPITMQGLTLMGLYLLGAVSAILFAAIFKRGMLRGASLPFYMELPPYRFPSFSSLGLQVWRRVQIFLAKAGRVILVGSIALWFLLNFPTVEPPEGATEAGAAQFQIENSLAADMGRALEPVFGPLGYDWRINIGLIGSFAARELMVSTMAQVYAYEGGEEEVEGFADLLTRADPATGEPLMSAAAGFSLMVFFVYAMLCVSTIAVVRRETASWRWPLFQFGYMTAVAWVGAFVTYQIAS
ncbi:MAG: ferrous iron transporter B [Planctomycetes bacterium]|nr:ferrous iron transporter B [Planctomycetota bacterium]